MNAGVVASARYASQLLLIETMRKELDGNSEFRLAFKTAMASLIKALGHGGGEQMSASCSVGSAKLKAGRHYLILSFLNALRISLRRTFNLVNWIDIR